MSSQKRQKTIEKNHRKRRWLERIRFSEKEIFQLRWSDAKCFFCSSICEKTNLIQTDQLLNAKWRHRHSCLQRFRSISTELNDWFERSTNNRQNRLRYWGLWNDEYCCQRTRRFDQYSAIERRISARIFHLSDLSDQDDEKRDSLKHRRTTITSKKIIFCVVESVENHSILENNFSNQTFEAFEAKSETFKSDLVITNKKWHEMLEHSKSKIIAHLAERINEIKVDDFESTSSINKCETCALIKTHEIVFRRIDQKESIDHSLNRIDYDLISMNEKYNDDYWINHFVCFRINMNFVYTHSKKDDAFSMIREFLKMTRIKYDQIVRFIRINDERTLKFEYREFMKLRMIVTKRFASYTSSQNDKIERFEKILIIRTKAMRIETNLSAKLWSKIFKAVNYLNNRILRRALNWKSSFEILSKKKSNLAHLQSYKCRAYLLKNIISKKNRLKSRAFIDYFVRYYFTHIFRISISSRMRVIRIRDVIFDKTLFYDLAKLDSKHLLIINVKKT
jgi:hypothetical protein